jgi:type IV secretory pathway VirB2 component (pilin)
MFKKFTAAAMAVCLVTAPTVAAAQSAAPVAPAVESVDGGNEIRGGFILPLAIIVAVVIGVLLLTGGDDEEDPITP